jgi:hypothetical protein
MLRDATEDLLAFTSFPPGYWKKIWSTEIIESLPGLGSILGAEFLVATGGNLTGFATAGRLAPYAGWCPSPRIPAASPETYVVPSATTGGCTWSYAGSRALHRRLGRRQHFAGASRHRLHDTARTRTAHPHTRAITDPPVQPGAPDKSAHGPGQTN